MFKCPNDISYNFNTIKISFIINYTADDESLFHGISIYNEPIYENFIENGRLFDFIS